MAPQHFQSEESEEHYPDKLAGKQKPVGELSWQDLFSWAPLPYRRNEKKAPDKDGTIIITGASSHLGMAAANFLLKHFPRHTAILTVRDDSIRCHGTNELREIVARYPKADVSIRRLDLAKLDDIATFAKKIQKEIWEGEITAITSIICIAWHWNLVKVPEKTEDGFDKSFQVTYLAHASLVLRLLGHMDWKKGRVIFLSNENSEVNTPPREKYPPAFPDNLDVLTWAEPMKNDDRFHEGLWRYNMAKLVGVTFINALVSRMRRDIKFAKITAITYDPGTLRDSHPPHTIKPSSIAFLGNSITRSGLTSADQGSTSVAQAGPELIKLATSQICPGVDGHFLHLNVCSQPMLSLVREHQRDIWAKTLRWARVSQKDTTLPLQFC